jgi:NLI interacting factor-like phosphatase
MTALRSNFMKNRLLSSHSSFKLSMQSDQLLTSMSSEMSTSAQSASAELSPDTGSDIIRNQSPTILLAQDDVQNSSSSVDPPLGKQVASAGKKGNRWKPKRGQRAREMTEVNGVSRLLMIRRRRFKLIARQNQTINQQNSSINETPSHPDDAKESGHPAKEETHQPGPQTTTISLPLRPAAPRNKNNQKQMSTPAVGQQREELPSAVQHDHRQINQTRTQHLPRGNGVFDPRLLSNWRNFDFTPSSNSKPLPVRQSRQPPNGGTNSNSHGAYSAAPFSSSSLPSHYSTSYTEQSKTENFRKSKHIHQSRNHSTMEQVPRLPSEEAFSAKDMRSRKLPVPTPTTSYLARTKIEDLLDKRYSPTLRTPRRLLVVIDLNGTLLSRTNRKSSFHARENVDKFLAYLLEHHYVMVWSSSRPQNVQDMVAQLLSKEQRDVLVAIWARDTLRLTPNQYANKVQVYKQLSWIWESDISSKNQDSGVWDQANTVLIDDSAKKAAAEPYNILQIPEFNGTNDGIDTLGQVLGYMKWLSLQSNVSYAIRQRPFKADGSWKWTWE